MKLELDKLVFDKDGLIPAVVQDVYSKKVLTVAYMNRESLEISLKRKLTCFYSRSRKSCAQRRNFGQFSAHRSQSLPTATTTVW